MDSKKLVHTADSGNVVPAPKASSAGYQFTSPCIDQHLSNLPQATRRVLLLGNADDYIKHLSKQTSLARGGAQPINDVAYLSSAVLFVHVSHPSKGNGHFGAFNLGKGTSGKKMLLAREALKTV